MLDSRQLKAAWRKPRLGRRLFPRPILSIFTGCFASGLAAFSRRTGAQSAPGKGKGMPQGKARFPLGHSLAFSCARKPQTFRSPRLTGGGCLFSPASDFASYGSRDEPPMTACGGNFIGGEISRNKQSPLWGELRRLRLRTTGPGAEFEAAQASTFPFVCTNYVT